MLPNQFKRVHNQNLLSPQRPSPIPKRVVPSTALIKFAGGGYMLCSSLMLITNKLAVTWVPAPGFVLFSQLFMCALFCFIFGSLNFIRVEHLQWTKIKLYIPAVFVFLGTIYFNMKTLQYCNVETFIVFRASTPIAVSIGDYLFLGRELPSYQSLLCLIGLIIGCSFYTYSDAGFNISGYRWLAAWYIIFLADQLYIKWICKKVKMSSNWGRVYYLNLLTCIPLFFKFIIYQELATITWSFYAIFFLSLSCVLGLGMSYFAFLARNAISATSFTVLGNICKVLTVLINLIIWDKHANLYGILSLSICLLCAYFYEQAPVRKSKNKDIDSSDNSKV